MFMGISTSLKNMKSKMLLVPDISDKGYLACIQSEFGLIYVSTLTCSVIAMLLIVLILVIF